jgi:uncharacterized protein YoxC
VNFSEQPPSKQWAALKYGGEKVAEVWFKPEGEPFALAFRIPRESFQIPGMDQLLTIENLLKALAIATEEAESWRHGGAFHYGMNGSNPDFGNPLPSPPEDVSHLSIQVSLKPPLQVVAPNKSGEPQSPLRLWQDLEARWGAILSAEAAINSLRQTMESLQTELQTSLQKTLTIEQKQNARNMDLAQWAKEKSRAHFGVPKVREFIHRATWALGLPERKALAEFFRDDIPPDVPIPQMDKLAEQLERLLKERQVLTAHGTKVYHECKTIAADIQGALRTLHSNAAANGERKRRAGAAKSKFLKDVRRLSGAD